MTNDEKRAEVTRIVREFTMEYLSRHLLWQLGQIVPGGDYNEAAMGAIGRLANGDADALSYTMEPQEWLTMALYGAGLIEADAGEMHEVCQGMAEWLFAVPGIYSYTIPEQWADVPMGGLWWSALLRAEGDDLITIAQAAELAGVSLQAIGQRIDRGTLRAFTDPLANKNQGKRLVRRSEVVAK